MEKKILFFIMAFLTCSGILSVHATKLPTPTGVWRQVSGSASANVELYVFATSDVSSAAQSSVLHQAYDSQLKPLKSDITSRSYQEFSQGVKWNFNGDPAKDSPFYRIKLTSSNYEDSDEELLAYDNKRVTLRPASITIDGQPLRNDQLISAGQVIRWSKEAAFGATSDFSEVKVADFYLSITSDLGTTTTYGTDSGNGYVSYIVPENLRGKDLTLKFGGQLSSECNKRKWYNWFDIGDVTYNVTVRHKYSKPVCTAELNGSMYEKVTISLSDEDKGYLNSAHLRWIGYNLADKKYQYYEVSMKSPYIYNMLLEEGDRYVYGAYLTGGPGSSSDDSDIVWFKRGSEKAELDQIQVMAKGKTLAAGDYVTFGTQLEIINPNVFESSTPGDTEHGRFPTSFGGEYSFIYSSGDYYDLDNAPGTNRNTFTVTKTLGKVGDVFSVMRDLSIPSSGEYSDVLMAPHRGYIDFKLSEKLDAPSVSYYQSSQGYSNFFFSMRAPENYTGEAKDVTFHYMLYFATNTMDETHLNEYSCERFSKEGVTFFSDQQQYFGGDAPLFVAGYVSANGWEDSDVVYAPLSGSPYTLEAPRVYVGDIPVVGKSTGESYLVPDGAQVRIVNPNVFSYTSEGDAAPFKTTFGQDFFYKNIPAGVEIDEAGTATFKADKSNNANLDLELSILPDNLSAFNTGFVQNIISLQVGGKIDVPTGNYNWKDIYDKYELNISGPSDIRMLPGYTLHYMEYFGAEPGKEKYSQMKTTKNETLYERLDKDVAPDFYGAYVSVPGLEDSDVIYFKAKSTPDASTAEGFRLESPYLMINGEKVADTTVEVDHGTEIFIVNPNSYPVLAKSGTAPFLTTFGSGIHKGVPSDFDSQRGSFIADRSNPSLSLELCAIPEEAYDKVFTGRNEASVYNVVVNDTQTGVDGIEVDADGSEEVYTLDGLRVTGKKLQKGVYIVVRNGKATKKVVND